MDRTLDVLVAPNYGQTIPNEGSIFLGGGITDCPDWQSEMISLLESMIPEHKLSSVVLFNPRRADFDVTNPKESEVQITWEFDHLEYADVVLFWFPKETMCPITLFELGKMVGLGRRIVVGCHPEYRRKFDVEFQLSLMDEGYSVVDSLEKLAEEAVMQLI